MSGAERSAIALVTACPHRFSTTKFGFLRNNRTKVNPQSDNRRQTHRNHSNSIQIPPWSLDPYTKHLRTLSCQTPRLAMPKTRCNTLFQAKDSPQSHSGTLHPSCVERLRYVEWLS